MTYTQTESNYNDPDAFFNDAPILLESLEHETGVRIDYVNVADGYESYPGRTEVQEVVAYIDQLLIDNPDWQAPAVDETTGGVLLRNPSSEVLYGSSDTLREWFLDAAQAHAIALYPLQHPEIDRLPSGGHIDNEARAFFYHGLDAIGIRTRAKIMTDIAKRQLNGQSESRWISLACGAAVPVMDALEACDDTQEIHLDLIDYNDEALGYAATLATYQAGLNKVSHVDEGYGTRSYATHNVNLIRQLVASDELVTKDGFGENSSDMVDALGIFEYFSHKDSVKFLRNAYRLVRDDGTLVIANMLSDRPQIEFNKRGVGWPKLYPRSIDELTAIINEAGIAPEQARVIVPEDGIYAVVEIKK